MNIIKRHPAAAFGLLLALVLAGATVLASSDTQRWAGSRTSAIHRIPLKDEMNQTIVPTVAYPLPFSARFTCAPCHEYETIAGGLHFSAAYGDAPAGRPGEPWIRLDERTGTQIPLSYRPGKGLFHPREVGLSPWDFTLLFGRHANGGGFAEPPESEFTPESRWNVSGRAEINCLGCHNAARIQDHGEWAKQILRQNFRWAATAAAGIGDVGGMASRLGPTWDIFDGPNRDDPEWAVAPSVKYDRTAFDSRHYAFLDVAGKPADDRCLACHSTAPIGSRRFDFEDDVHSAAGVACVACHGNDVSHDMVRGYEGEAADNPGLLSEEFTCRACHLGAKTASGGVIQPGRLGAPYPRHYGLPEVHLERLACTVCHSGPQTEGGPVRIRTSRANRLGIFGVADWATDLPAIVEPVVLRAEDGKLAPHRMMWPAYWGRLEEGAVRPLATEAVEKAAGDLLYPERAATRVLAALARVPDRKGTPVLVLDGAVYEVNIDGGLNKSPSPEGAAASGPGWAWRGEGLLSSLLPSFDPADAEAAADPEAAIQAVLEALRTIRGVPGEPVILVGRHRYRLTDGYLNKEETDAQPEPGPAIYRLDGETLLPLLPTFEAEAIAALTGTGLTLTETQVARVLSALAETEIVSPVYISGGRIFTLDPEGRLRSGNHEAAAPVAWPLAHQVRPARKSLGIGGCTDCHGVAAPFFFSQVRGSGPLQTPSVQSRSAITLMGLSYPYHRLFGLTFAFRPVFKIVLGIAAFLVGAVLLTALVLAVGRMSGLIEKRR